MTSMKIVPFSRPPTPLSIYVQNSSAHFFQNSSFFPPNSSKILHTTWTSNFKQTPHSPNDNQSIKGKHNPNLTICVIRFFLQFGFCLQYQLINLVWLSFDFFSFSRSPTICFFVALYSCVCCCPQIS